MQIVILLKQNLTFLDVLHAIWTLPGSMHENSELYMSQLRVPLAIFPWVL